MGWDLFLRGLIIGFAIAAPVGPIGLLCIRRALAGGFAYGFATGLGAAAADAIYGAVAAFGLTAVSGFLVAQQMWLRLIGGAALIALGVKTAMKKPPIARAADRTENLGGAFAQTLALTLANPATILSFVAVFAGFGLGGDAGRSPMAAATIVLGVLIGSAAWWLVLAGATAAIRRQFPPAAISWINRASGAAIAAFGVAAIASVAF